MRAFSHDREPDHRACARAGRYLPRFFTDDLTFVRSAGGPWQIISKVWHFELLDER